MMKPQFKLAAGIAFALVVTAMQAQAEQSTSGADEGGGGAEDLAGNWRTPLLR